VKKIEEVKRLIAQYDKVTILTNRCADGDSVGTALAIYTLLKSSRKQVEVVSFSNELPYYLDFLPNFSKIKSHIDFNESLIIACDSKRVESLGFDVSKEEIINIDHDAENSEYGTVNVVDKGAVATSEVAYRLFNALYTIEKKSALCLYTALVADSDYFTTSKVNKKSFELASELLSYGIDTNLVRYNLKERRSLASLRLLTLALSSIEIYLDGELVSLSITKENFLESGATLSDSDGVVAYPLSLATAKVGVVLVELESAVRVSMRSKGIDILPLAYHFKGSGERESITFELQNGDLETIGSKIIDEIKQRKILNET